MQTMQKRVGVQIETKCASPECHSLHHDAAGLINVYFQQPCSALSERS